MISQSTWSQLIQNKYTIYLQFSHSPTLKMTGLPILSLVCIVISGTDGKKWVGIYRTLLWQKSSFLKLITSVTILRLWFKSKRELESIFQVHPTVAIRRRLAMWPTCWWRRGIPPHTTVWIIVSMRTMGSQDQDSVSKLESNQSLAFKNMVGNSVTFEQSSII